ncbi:MAG: GNAT family N-acetyltransferase [Burkholderiales bacterium]|nr:GNAT family N-acetyltransferase [Burkholderiales bacterium]
MDIRLESPNQPDVMALIAALDAYQSSLYPAESNHFVDIATLDAPTVLFAVARDDAGSAVACGAVMLLDDGQGGAYGEVKRMFVHPTHRGRGTAAALLQALGDASLARGVRCLRLETGIHQQDAIRLYERAGFVRRGPFGDYRPDPLSVFMERNQEIVRK